VTAVFIGLATYFIVFNLDALASLGWTTYSGFRQKRIGQMEDDDKWQERARGYNRFEPDRGNNKPSEWYILLYCLLHPFGYQYSGEEGEVDDSVRSGRSSFVITSISTAETSRAEAWKAWLGRLVKRPQENPGKTAETSRGIAWRGWVRALFTKSDNNGKKNGPNPV
jgi:hypothetical protein